MQALTKLFCDHPGCRSYGSSCATTFIYQGLNLPNTFSCQFCIKLNCFIMHCIYVTAFLICRWTTSTLVSFCCVTYSVKASENTLLSIDLNFIIFLNFCGCLLGSYGYGTFRCLRFAVTVWFGNLLILFGFPLTGSVT